MELIFMLDYITVQSTDVWSIIATERQITLEVYTPIFNLLSMSVELYINEDLGRDVRIQGITTNAMSAPSDSPFFIPESVQTAVIGGNLNAVLVFTFLTGERSHVLGLRFANIGPPN